MTPPAETTVENNPQPAWIPFVQRLRAFVAARVPAADADDVSQDVLLRLHQGAPRLRDHSKAQAWVYSVARRAIADFYRQRRPEAEPSSNELERLADPTSAIEERLARFDGTHSVHEEVLSWLRPLAEQLPTRYREAVLLADFDGRSQRVVAQQLGLSLSGAKSRVQRGRKLLAESLRRCCEIELGAEGRAQDFARQACDCQQTKTKTSAPSSRVE